MDKIKNGAYANIHEKDRKLTSRFNIGVSDNNGNSLMT